jgi:hypothetical protein
MKAARIRLVVAAVLFVGWLGYLGFLALGHAQPPLLSHSQMLVATHFVKADVALDSAGKPERVVQVRESFGNRPVQDEKIAVDNLAEARVPGGKPKPLTAAGTYLLLLRQTGPGRFEVVAATSGQRVDSLSQQYWVYPWSEEIERQLRDRLAMAE